MLSPPKYVTHVFIDQYYTGFPKNCLFIKYLFLGSFLPIYLLYKNTALFWSHLYILGSKFCNKFLRDYKNNNLSFLYTKFLHYLLKLTLSNTCTCILIMFWKLRLKPKNYIKYFNKINIFKKQEMLSINILIKC